MAFSKSPLSEMMKCGRFRFLGAFNVSHAHHSRLKGLEVDFWSWYFRWHRPARKSRWLSLSGVSKVSQDSWSISRSRLKKVRTAPLSCSRHSTVMQMLPAPGIWHIYENNIESQIVFFNIFQFSVKCSSHCVGVSICSIFSDDDVGSSIFVHRLVPAER